MADMTLGVTITGDASDLQRAAEDSKKSIKSISSQSEQTASDTSGAANKIAGAFKNAFSGLKFGVLMGVGQKAFDVLSSAASGFKDELEDASAAWQTFEKNAEMNGHAAEEIAGIKKELQDFATQTIYSASDMATTYAQLDAVGIKSAEDLVKGFGGIAAAAENPAQAMKTLSQQGVQMAAKPKVAWQDFKLMLEQTPAGIAAVAKEMGMTTAEMVTAVQDGKIKTEDFFNAIEKVGTSDAFVELATEYKTTEQAMDGLHETIQNKLMPSFELLQDKGIDAIEKIIEKVDSFDGEKMRTEIEKIMSGFETGGIGGGLGAIGELLNSLPPEIKQVGSAAGALAAVDITQGILSSEAWNSCVDGIKELGNVGAGVAGKLQDLPAIAGAKISEMDGPIKTVVEKASGLSAKVGEVGGGIWDAFANNTAIGKAVTTVGDGLGTIGGTITKVGGTMADGLTTMMNTAMQAIMPAAMVGVVLAGLGLLYTQFGDQINELINLAITKGPEIIKGLADGITARIPDLIASGAGLVTRLLDVVTANLPAIISGGAKIIISLVKGVAKAAPSLIGKLVEVVGTLLTSLAEVMPQMLTAGMEILQAIGQGITDNLPVLMEFAFQALQMLITGFTENLPQILGIAVQIIMMLVQGLTEHLPELIEMAVVLITMLANAFIENLPLFIEAAVTIITALGTALIENLPLLIEAAIQIVGALWQVICETDWLALGKQVLDAIGQGLFGDDWAGIKQSLKDNIEHIKEKWQEFKDNTKEKFEEIKESVKDKIHEMVEKVVEKVEEFKSKVKEKFEEIKQGVEEKIDGIKQGIEDGFNAAVEYITGLIDDAWGWGADLVSNIADGIWSGVGKVKDAVWDVGGTIFGNLHFSEPDEGPLADFHTWMPDMMHGLADGMKKNLPTLRAGVELVANEMSGIIPGTGGAYAYAGGGASVSNLGGVTIQVYGAEGQDEETIADRVMAKIMELVELEG